MKKYMLSVCLFAVCSSMAACSMQDGIDVRYQCLDDRSVVVQYDKFLNTPCNSTFTCERIDKPEQFGETAAVFDVCYRCSNKNEKYCGGKCIGIDEECGCKENVCLGDGKTLMKCGKNGEKEEEICIYGCENNTCLETCMDRCVDEMNILKCQADGSRIELECPYGCDLSLNVCKKECEDGQYKCKENTLYKCSSNGVFEVENDCVGLVCSAEEKICKSCGEDELLINDDNNVNKCVPKCTKDSCDEGLVCSVETGECEKCRTGHYDSTKKDCVEDSKKACGWDDKENGPRDCSKIENVKDVDCESGLCVVAECDAGFHKSESGDACEEDTVDSCGESRKICTGIANATAVACQGGGCAATKCEAGYSISGNVCVGNDDKVRITSDNGFAPILFGESVKMYFSIILEQSEELDVELSLQDNKGIEWADNHIQIKYKGKLSKNVTGIKYNKEQKIEFELVTGDWDGVLPTRNYFDDVRIAVVAKLDGGVYSQNFSNISYFSMADIIGTVSAKDYIEREVVKRNKLPAGRYEITLYGAGGANGAYSDGGAGGVARGIIEFAEPTETYIHIGTTGRKCHDRNVCNGQNGGANGSTSKYGSLTYGFGGGGATDFRIGGDDFYHRALVAGGGGGSAYGTKSNGGDGGWAGSDIDDKGSRGKDGVVDNTKGLALGGDNVRCLNESCAFGKASSAGVRDNRCGGGGGGWFSGMSGQLKHESGAGGSGFILSAETYDDYIKLLVSLNKNGEALDRKYIMEPVSTKELKAKKGDYNGQFSIKCLPLHRN